MDSKDRPIKRIAVALAVALALAMVLLVTPFYAYFHNHYVFPLGRLARSIEIGDPYDSVYAKLADYESRREGNQVELVEFETDTDLRHVRTIPKSKAIAIYDVSVFDDVQLTVRFDEKGGVAEILFVGD